ncbi:hypothetical protein [Streptomyces sp. NPDC050560]|uniref:hypothetical protein n=1 Tax=Streptomyces sp. NPDC050560 TaxID=3365630 RepID=UPI0037B2802B
MADGAGVAEDLAYVLRALGGAGRPAGVLPGEEAAVAAFRAVREARGEAVRRERVGSAVGAGSGYGSPGAPAPDEEPGTIRLGSAAQTRQGVPRWGRPVRFGLAAALAGCMIGGVAMAAGAGILPFGGTREPGPAVSVSGAATPERPLASHAPRSSTSGSPSADDSDGGGASHGAAGGSHQPETSGPGGEGGHGKGKAKGATKGSGRQGEPQQGGQHDDDWWQRLVSSCEDYRGGKPLDDDRRAGLESAAHGPSGVQHLCDTVLGAAGGHDSPSPGPGDTSGAEDPHHGGSGSAGDDEQDGGAGQGKPQDSPPDKDLNNAPGKDASGSADTPSPSDTASGSPGV